jgi:hypothetical protein
MDRSKSPKSKSRKGKIRENIAKKKPRGRPFEKGNPGKPLGAKNFKGAYIRIMELVKQPLTINGVVYEATGIDQLAYERYLIAKTLPRKSLAKQRAMDAIENRIEGLPVQAIKNVGEDNKKLRIIFDDVAKESKSLPNEEGSDGEKDASD